MTTDFRSLYEENEEYVRRRDPASFEARRTEIEVRKFKAPNLAALIPGDFHATSVVEVGCGTGELLAELVQHRIPGTRGIGFDLSPSNIAAARARYPSLEFRHDDFEHSGLRADIVVLSDVLEHVPDDVAFLRAASALGSLTLINLPLEDNWLNSRREYGPQDASGHLRRYTLSQGLELITHAGLSTIAWRRIWVHETDCERERALLRQQLSGSAYGGGAAKSALKRAILAFSRRFTPFGRRLFSSNLFACAQRH